jgi:hypothetical protein
MQVVRRIVCHVLILAGLSSVSNCQDPTNTISELTPEELSYVDEALTWLDVAILQYCALPAPDPATKACLKLARDAVKDMVPGLPTGENPVGGQQESRPSFFVARTDPGNNG